MVIRIYLSNLAKYTEGRENGKWILLPMEQSRLTEIYNTIVGEGQEGIILDYNAPFVISEFENVFKLNEDLNDINMLFDETVERIIFHVADTKEEAFEALQEGNFTIINVNEVAENWSASLNSEELYGMVLNEEGFNNLFSQPIPEEMIDYIDFAQIWTCLSINAGRQAVTIDGNTYLITLQH